ncbi:MAG: adenylyltransferase/cytidyltransferase family protein [Candidatus Thorarchaeota archaeon]
MADLIVLAAGKFDILHLGHLAYLEQCRKLAGKDGELVVVIALDSTIKSVRGVLPIFPQEHRRRIVESLEIVDRAVLGYDSMNHSDIVEDIKPDIIALGYDQYTNIESLEECFRLKGLPTKIVRLEKLSADGLDSSSLIRGRIFKYYRESGKPID